MSGDRDEILALREECRNLGYLLCKAWGIVWLCNRLGLPLKPWVVEREEHGVQTGRRRLGMKPVPVLDDDELRARGLPTSQDAQSLAIYLLDTYRRS